MLYIHSIPCEPWMLYEQRPVLCRDSCTRLGFWSLLFISDHSCSLARCFGFMVFFTAAQEGCTRALYPVVLCVCLFSLWHLCFLVRVSVHSFSFIQCVGLEKEISFKRSSTSSWKRLQKMSQVDVMLEGLNGGWLNSEQDSLEFNWVGSLGKGGAGESFAVRRRDWGVRRCAGRSFEAAWGGLCSWQLLGSQRYCSPKASQGRQLAPIMRTARIHMCS